MYLSTVLGAWIADRLLGSERTLFRSAVLIMLGHISLALLPGLLGVAVGLCLVGLGSGGLKANATSLVGALYPEGDDRRDAGFSIFYMGINIGALVGPLLTGLARSWYGFHVGFGLAAIGMAIGLVQYSMGRRNLAASGGEVPNPLAGREVPKVLVGAAALVVLIVVAVLTGLVTLGTLAAVVTAAIVVAAVGYFALILGSRKITAAERSRVVAFIPMFIASFAFWSLFQQQFTVVAIYAESRIDRTFFDFTMPPAWVTSINPIFIILLAPVFAALWTKLGPRQPSTPIKFALGVVGMGVAFLIFLTMAGTTGATSPLGLVVILLFFTIAELLLSPIGLSLSTKLAPAAFRTQMVALFFLSVAAGSSLAGVLAGYYTPENEVAYFSTVGGAAIVLGGLIALISPWVKRRMPGVL